MKRLVAVLLGVAFLFAAPAPQAAPQCQTINAMDDSVLLPPGPDCPSPVGFCASSDRVQGNHGFRGSFFFSALAFDPIPSDPLGRLAVSGVSTFTLEDGSVTISDVSAFDVQAGTFSGVGRITSGTGRFAGAFGDVFTAGRVQPSGSAFTTETTMEICYAP
jgi:hypothetical protein